MSESSSRTNEPPKTWQQTKSENTRTAILEATLDCLYRLGYGKTTTEVIAQVAGMSRGALLHHFANRQELVRAAIEHLTQKRLREYLERQTAIQRGGRHSRISAGIDEYWRQLNTPEFVVFHELLVASRTDEELRAALRPANDAFRTATIKASQQVFPDLAQSESFREANELTRYLLEGMAIARVTEEHNVEETLMLNWLKRTLRAEFKDVLPDSSSLGVDHDC